MDFFALDQLGSTGRVVKIDGVEWVTLYKVPVVNENAKLYDFYIAAKVGQPLPAACHLVMVSKVEKVAEEKPSDLNTDKPA